MILTTHLLFGTMIASKMQNPILAITLAFLSHYLLDFLPHVEYPVENITDKKWKKALPDFLKVLLDFILGITLILILAGKSPIIFICAFFAILPDGLSILGSITKNRMLKSHSEFHQEKIHFFKYKKIPIFWRILSQILVVVISIALLI